MSERKVIIIGSRNLKRSDLMHLLEVLDDLDELGVEYELQEAHNMLLHRVEEIPEIKPVLEDDSKPYPEPNHKKGRKKRF